MENDTSNCINLFWLEIPINYKDYLMPIRNLENIKLAFDREKIWLRNITRNQIESPDFQQIPFKKIYYLNNNLLFKKDSLLPYRKIPLNLLWTTIDKALPIKLPNFNHNYFGVHEKLKIELEKSDLEKPVFALYTSYEKAKKYLESTLEFRLIPLKWIVIDNKIFILGTPLLPIDGKTFWKKNNILLPSGYDFKLPLYNSIEKLLNPDGDNYLIWINKNGFIRLKKQNFKELSISSFRQTV